jgi:hypothetical protein
MILSYDLLSSPNIKTNLSLLTYEKALITRSRLSDRPRTD